MKPKYTILAVAAVALFGLGVAIYAHAQFGAALGFGGHRGKGNILAHLTRKFDLTPAQQAEVKQMWQSEKPTLVPLVSSLQL